MNRKLRRIANKNPLTLILPQEVSDETRAALVAEARTLGWKGEVKFTIEAPKAAVVWKNNDNDAPLAS